MIQVMPFKRLIYLRTHSRTLGLDKNDKLTNINSLTFVSSSYGQLCGLHHLVLRFTAHQ